MHNPVAVATTAKPTITATTTTTITRSSNKFQIQKPQQNFKKIKINKKQTQNLQQNPNPTGQSMTKLNQPSAARLVTAPG